jgi:hypothetical protein
MEQAQTFGKLLRIDVRTRIRPGTGEAESLSPETINFDYVARLRVGRGNTAVFVMNDGQHIPSTLDFEVANAAWWAAQSPRPPMSRRELQNRDLMANEECDPIFAEGFDGR